MDEVSEAAMGAVEELRAELAMLGKLDRDLGASLDLEIVAGVLLDYALWPVVGAAGMLTLEDERRDLSLQVKRGSAALLTTLEGQTLEQLLAHGDGAKTTEGFSYLAIPIRFQQRLVGGLVLARPEQEPFTDAETVRVQRLVGHGSAAVGNALLYRELAEANQARLFFVSKISHELKTPLAAIQGYSELIHSGLTGEITAKQRKFLASIKRNITRTTAYIQNLADMTRLEAGRLDLLIEPRDFSKIVDEAVRAVDDEYEERGTQLTVDVPAALPAVLADDFRLVQILTNLLANACTYAPPGASVTLTVRDTVPEAARAAAGDLTPGPLVYCAVQDTGYGISEEDQRQLFTKFFRSSAANIRQTPGGGMGLALAKGVLALHGGTIWCDSTLGAGSTFHLVLPQA